jgi:hypothetical protein
MTPIPCRWLLDPRAEKKEWVHGWFVAYAGDRDVLIANASGALKIVAFDRVVLVTDERPLPSAASLKVNLS